MTATPAMTTDLNRIAAWVRTHQFATRIAAGAVEIDIPYVGRDGSEGIVTERVRTYQEARDALGY